MGRWMVRDRSSFRGVHSSRPTDSPRASFRPAGSPVKTTRSTKERAGIPVRVSAASPDSSSRTSNRQLSTPALKFRTRIRSYAFPAGSGVTPGTLLTSIASVVLVLVFVWVMWVTVGTFRAWQDGQVALFDLVWAALRASIVLLVLGFYLR